MKKAIWDRVREEAEDFAKYDQPLDITGSDYDPRMIKVAQENAAEAGFMDLIKLANMRCTGFDCSRD